ncbi:MAG: hypothetical protein ACKOCT_09760, partial [Alphaproteobacteria bacterium]
ALDDLRRLASEAEVLWLPPWVFLDRELERGLERFRSGEARVATAAVVLRDPDASIRLPRTVLVARPGAAEVRSAALVARPGAPAVAFEGVVEMRPPSLSAHLRGIDHQAAVEARLREEAGERARSVRLALVPLARLAAAMAGSSGDRRSALARATLESFRGVLVQAKLWERSSVDAGVA